MDLQMELEEGLDNPESFLMPLSPSHRPSTDNESHKSSPEFAGFFPEPRHKVFASKTMLIIGYVTVA